MQNLPRNGTNKIDLGLPGMKKVNSESDLAEVKLTNTVKWMDPQDAARKLGKLLDIDLPNIYVPLTQAALQKFRHRKMDAMRF